MYYAMHYLCIRICSVRCWLSPWLICFSINVQYYSIELAWVFPNSLGIERIVTYGDKFRAILLGVTLTRIILLDQSIENDCYMFWCWISDRIRAVISVSCIIFIVFVHLISVDVCFCCIIVRFGEINIHRNHLFSFINPCHPNKTLKLNIVNNFCTDIPEWSADTSHACSGSYKD